MGDETSSRDEERKRLSLEVKERYSDILRAIPGVTGLGVNGSIIVYVKELTPQLQGEIPKEIEGVPIRVVQFRPRLMSAMMMEPLTALYADRTARQRPVPGGVSIGHPAVTAGTFGCPAFDTETGEVLGLSNNHICALDWGLNRIGVRGDPVLQPGPVDGGREPYDIIAALERWKRVETPPRLNNLDAALFKPTTPEVLDVEKVLEIGKVFNSVEPKVGMEIVGSGRSSGVTYSRLVDVNATLSVDGGEAGEAVFEDVCVAMPACGIPGDSGSWRGQVGTSRTVGLLFAGDDAATVICKGVSIEGEMGVYLLPPVEYTGGKAILGAWAGVLGLGVAGILRRA